MALSSDDRKAFSLKIVSADQEVAVYSQAKAQLSAEVDRLQKLDDANKNLFDPVNTQINQYQLELTALDGLTRSTFTETNIQDSAAVKIGNYFYPNNVQVTVPSLSSTNNVWTKAKPFALSYAIGKNYSEAQPIVTKEGDIINTIKSLITSAGSNTAIQLATGLAFQAAVGFCSNPSFTTQPTCVSGGGTWNPGSDSLITNTTVQTLKTNMVNAVNNLKAFLQTEATLVVTDDKDSALQAQNNAAINDINTVIIPALNTWLAYVDFNSTGVNVGNFNSFNAATLAPTKLSSVQLTALNTALTTRLAFISTRETQLLSVLGTCSQDLSTGDVTTSGLYGKRYNLLLLRLDILNGSLNKLVGMKSGSNAQDSIISSIKQNKNTYLSVLPTSPLAAPGNGTSTVQVVDPSLFSPGDTVFVMSENQEELQRAIKSINGKAVVLNDIVPAKYKTTDKLRIYKDIT